MLPVLALVVGGAALITAAILLVAVVGERGRLDALYSQESQHALDSWYKTSRLSFCYERNLNPCVDNVIEVWNNVHPDDTFTIAPPVLPTTNQ